MASIDETDSMIVGILNVSEPLSILKVLFSVPYLGGDGRERPDVGIRFRF